MPSPARSETGDPLLLTPGPLTTSKSVKQAMVHDWGSRDATFIALNAEVMESLPRIIHGEGAFVTVPMQGSGTFAVEAMLTTQRRLRPARQAHSRRRGPQGVRP